MQMLLGAVLVDALHAALEDAVVALNRVGVDPAANIFLLAVIDGIVARKLLPHLAVVGCFVSHQRALAGDVLANDRRDIRGSHAINMKTTCASAALDKRKNDILVSPASAALGLARLPPDEGFIRLDDRTATAHRGKIALPHRLAKAMGHEPCGLVGDLEGPMQLMGGNSLLAGRQQMGRLEPFVQRHMAGLKDRADLAGELLTALSARPKAGAGRLAL